MKAVLGDLNDSKLIQKLSAQSDVVFHTATADHLESAQAILAGIEERASQGMSLVLTDEFKSRLIDSISFRQENYLPSPKRCQRSQ